MSSVDEISKAIGAHAMWKQRLRDAIDTGKSEFSASNVKPDNLCQFGKWLYGLSPTDRTSAHWTTVKDLHAKFHATAGAVLELALQGKRQEAEKAFGLNSPFANASSDLTSAMMRWKADVEKSGARAAA